MGCNVSPLQPIRILSSSFGFLGFKLICSVVLLRLASVSRYETDFLSLQQRGLKFSWMLKFSKCQLLRFSVYDKTTEILSFEIPGFVCGIFDGRTAVPPFHVPGHLLGC